MNIILVRHGESLGNVSKHYHKDYPDHALPLSQHGEKQATSVGGKLNTFLTTSQQFSSSVGKVRIWASPYARTRATARLIQDELNMPWTTIDYREHINLVEQQFGLFDGVEDAQLPLKFPVEYENYAHNERFEGRFWARMPLGESRFDVAVRVHDAFGTFHRDAEKHGIETIIVVCHGVTMRAFVMQWKHLTPEWFEKEKNPGNCEAWLLTPNGDSRHFSVIADGKY